MKNVGIWVDKKEAKIVSLVKGKEHLNIIKSNVEDFNVKGGSGTRFKGGPQDVVQDSKYLEREKHQFNNFFNEIIELITDIDALVIIGPAQTGEKLETFLLNKHLLIHSKLLSVIKTDTMTNNQLIAWVKEYYVSNKKMHI